MASILKNWREAATLILVTSSNISRSARIQLTNATNETTTGGSTNSDLKARKQSIIREDDFEVLMLKRSAKSKFMPNVYVFPGGVADDSDFSAQWLSVFNKLGQNVCKRIFEDVTVDPSKAAPMFTRERSPAYTAIPSEVAFRICAIRETFEESGVLLAQPANQSIASSIYSQNRVLSPALLHEDVNVINNWRQRVNKDPTEFLKMCLELDVVPEVWSLYEWSNWLTPTVRHEQGRRFDTAFYVCCVDHKPTAAVDSAETVNALVGNTSLILILFFTFFSVLYTSTCLSKKLNSYSFRTVPIEYIVAYNINSILF